MRPKEEISKEYAETCTALGDLEYRISCMESDKILMLNKLNELNQEAAAIVTGEQNAQASSEEI